MTNSNNHISVLLDESIKALDIKQDGIYVDCTLGRCGHSKQILKKLNGSGNLIGIDCDQTAIDWANKELKQFKNIHLVKSKFSKIKTILNNLAINEINGCLFDLGVSSPQLDNYERGFSYHTDAKLDMRMDQAQKLDAHYIVNNYSMSELSRIFKEYGQSIYSNSVAKAICEFRKTKPVNTNQELVEIIKSVLPKKELVKAKHPAKVFFQALRIETNDEKNEIIQAISSAIEKLSIHGRLVVISFHSLESNWVNQAIKKATVDKNLPSYLPINNEPKFKIIKSPKVSNQELEANNRSRSAKLHIIERSH